MTKQINSGWIFLTIVRIASLILIVLSIAGFIGVSGLFSFGGHLFSTQQNVAEDQPHGADALGGLLSVGIGFVWLAASSLMLIVGLIAYFVSTKKLKNKNF